MKQDMRIKESEENERRLIRNERKKGWMKEMKNKEREQERTKREVEEGDKGKEGR